MGIQSFVAGGKPSYRIKSNPTGVVYLGPAPSDSPNVSPGAYNGSMGSWVELTAALGYAAYLCAVIVRAANSDDALHVEIGTGAAGAEKVVARVCSSNSSGSVVATDIRVWPLAYLPSGARVAARAQSLSYSTPAAGRVALVLVRASDLEAF